ncbi:MAG: hypothetical protein AAF497_14470 [Planctomycetota bacterium]
MRSLLLSLIIAPIAAADIFSIGNSLTIDTFPTGYADAWNLCASQNLQSINDNPNGSQCIAGSTPWNVAFASTSFDVVTVQPYLGTTLTQDFGIISNWVDMQPNAVWVIHTGWAGHADHATDYHAADSTDMGHRPQYFNDLKSLLEAEHPTVEFRINPAAQAMELISSDIAAGVAPIDGLSELYRDSLHVTTAEGRYLHHELMRQTIGLGSLNASFGVDAATRDYFDQVIARAAIPEPSPCLTLTGLFLGIGLARRAKVLYGLSLPSHYPSRRRSWSRKPWEV